MQAYLSVAANGTASGPVSVSSSRAWKIEGYVNTSKGRVDTTIEATNSFLNTQEDTVFVNTDVLADIIYKQSISQNTEQQELTTTVSPTGTVQTQHDISYPLVVYSNESPESGGFFVASSVKQGKTEELRSPLGANSPNPVVTSETITTSDTTHYDPNGNGLYRDNNAATSSYGAKDAEHHCVYRALGAKNLILTSFEDSTRCSLAP